jgi:hypothetical protein
MYDSYIIELCTMYDFHGIYLRVLWTIYMYKISRCHVVIFYGFFVPFTEFQQKSVGSDKNRAELITSVFRKTGRFIGEIGRISVFPIFTVPPSSPVRFDRIFSIFTDFYRIFKNPTGSVKSSFPYSTKYLNTDPNSQVHDGINVEFVA